MTNLNVRIVATANTSQAKAGVAGLEAQTAALNAQLERTVGLSAKGLNPAGFRAARDILARNSDTFRAAAASSGMFEVSQLKLNSATQDYVQLLQKQKVGMGQFLKSRKLAAAAYKEQLALQNMFARQVGTNAKGQGIFDVAYNPRVSAQMDTARNKIGFLREELKNVAQQTVNWGKNTQWAGRQLMVGFTMPILAAGAATGVLAFQIDKQLTRIQKVYDTTANQNNTTMKGQMAVARELAEVRGASLEMAKTAASSYGASVKDTLEVEADLAATGLKGIELRQATTEVVKNATLGEIDYQTALQATIAMQSTFRMSQQEVSDAWAYMNSVENSTSLSMKDFATAIPIAAGPIKAMGGDIKLLGEYLVAMKERGIGAAQGANAVKAIMQRIYRPSKQVREEFQKLTHVDLTEMVQRNKGNIEGMMNDLAEATRGLDRPNEVRALAGLFGSWQVTRLGAILEGVRDLHDGIGQISDAHRIGEQSAQQWANVQQYELEQMRKSLSGKFRIALETLKANLVDVGNTFLSVGINILGIISKIVEKFNGLPDGVKKISVYGAIFLAVVGPLVMLTGLFGNLIGSLGKLGLAIAGIGGKFTLLTKEQKAAELAAELANAQFVKGSTMAKMLSDDIMMLSQSYAVANKESTKFADSIIAQRVAAGQMAGPVAQAAMGGKRAGDYRTEVPGATYVGRHTAAIEETDKAAKKAGTSIARMGLGMAAFSAAAVLSMASTNKTADNLANMVMMATLLGPVLSVGKSAVVGISERLKTSILPSLANARGNTSAWVASMKAAPIASMGKGIAGIGKGIVAMLGPVGLFVVGLTAALALLKKMHDEAQKGGEEVKKMYDNAAPLGKLYNFDVVEPGKVDVNQTQAAKAGNRVRELGNEYTGLIAKIRDARGEQAKFNEAWRGIAMPILQSGGTIEQAKQAMTDALTAADKATGMAQKRANARAIMLKFKGDFDNIDGIVDQAVKSTNAGVAAGMKSVDVEGFWAAGWENVKDPLSYVKWGHGASTAVSSQARAQLQASAKNLRFIYEQELNKTGDSARFAENLAGQLQAVDQKINKSTGDSRIKWLNFRKDLIKSQGAAFGMSNITDHLSDDFYANADAIEVMNKMYLEFSKNTARNAGAQNIGRTLGGQTGLDTVMGAWDKATNKAQVNLNKASKSTYLLERGTSAYSDAMDHAASKAEKLKNSIKNVRDNILTPDELTSNLQSAMTNTQDQVANIAETNFQNRMDASMGALQAAQERRMEGLRSAQERESRRLEAAQDNAQRGLEARQEAASRHLDSMWENRQLAAEKRWDKREKMVAASFDNRINKINKEIKAEERAEKIRQRIFDAEISRIQRLAETANQRVDFNAALSGGNLDEAAKIRNQMEASQAEWALSDAGEAGASRSENKVDRLQNRIDNIEKLKDKRLEALKEERDAFFRHLSKMEDREKRSLQKRQEAAERALKKRQDTEKRALERRQTMQEKNLQKETDNNTAAQQEIWENRRDKLNRAIEDFRAYVPKNAKDLQRHINNVAKKYGEFRVDMRGKFNKTAVDVREMLYRQIDLSRREMTSKINWAVSGAQITDKLLKGAFGLNRQQFYQWMTTGVFPKGSKPKTAAQLAKEFKAKQRTGLGAHHGGTQIDTVGHSGGYLGGNNMPWDRAGIKGKKHHSEVNLLAQKGEYVVQKDAVKKYGVDMFNKLNNGQLHPSNPRRDKSRKNADTLGGMGMGLSGILTAGLGAALKTGVASAASFGADNAIAAQMARETAAAVSGVFSAGALKGFDADQMRNAAIIANVGSSMGMSKRDIQIAFMTAIVESGMRNLHYGDRDSVGMFQQRDPWGSFATRVSPQGSSRLFFQALKQVKNRANMSMGEAAQTVQVSAFPGRYAQHQAEAAAIWAALKQRPAGGGGAFIPGQGGRHRPVNGGHPGGIHDSYTGYPAVDVPVPVGSAVYAPGSGRITRSYDIRGYEPRSNHGGLGYRSYGRVIYEKLDSGPTVLFAHLSQRLASSGQRVPGGSVIGRSGNTGHSYGPHLHFGARGASPYAFFKDGAADIRWDNTFANLHHGEAVLSKPINEEFKRGVKNFANGGGGDTINIDMNFSGDVNDKTAMRRFIFKTLDEYKARLPQSRKGED